jgi:uncharacterized protein YjbJ (UPF0337 family)
MASGEGEDIKGRVKEAAGALSDNDSLEREGEAQQGKAASEKEARAKQAEADEARADAAGDEAAQRANQQ